jgi:hypothetical protein
MAWPPVSGRKAHYQIEFIDAIARFSTSGNLFKEPFLAPVEAVAALLNVEQCMPALGGGTEPQQRPMLAHL